MNNSSSEYLPGPEDMSNIDPEPEPRQDNAPLRPGEFDPLATEPAVTAVVDTSGKSKKSIVECWSPSKLKSYQPPPNQNMVGDYHLQRGAPTVLAGPPGSGKSRGTLWLAVMGARGKGNWFGLEVHCQFRTLIIQCENSLTRLHRDFEAIGDVAELDEWIRVTSFPAYQTFKFSDPAFRNALKAMIREFQPQLIIIDPWNRVAKDSMQKDYQEALEHVYDVMSEFPDAACMIIHHLRKPKADDRQTGRGLANLLSGSNLLEGAARAVLIMQPASDDVEDVQVVLTTAKNNDGQHGARTAWERKAGWFEPIEEFDWEAFDAGGPRREAKVNEDHIREIFNYGKNTLTHKRAAERLEEVAGVKHSAAYNALKRFAHMWVKDEVTGLLSLHDVGGGAADDAENYEPL